MIKLHVWLWEHARPLPLTKGHARTARQSRTQPVSLWSETPPNLAALRLNKHKLINLATHSDTKDYPSLFVNWTFPLFREDLCLTL